MAPLGAVLSLVLYTMYSMAAAPAAAAQVSGHPYAQAGEGLGPWREAADGARALLIDFMERQGVPGMAIAVGYEGAIVWNEGLGLANVEHGVPVTPLTKFRSGSVAKPVMAAALALAYERGQIDLDAPVQRYVPSFPDKGGVITPRMLAGHLAGIRYYPPEGDEFFNTARHTDILQGLEAFQHDPLLFPPGTRYHYSSYGTNLLGAALQQAVGRPFLNILQETVFDPLGMISTVGDHSDSIISYRTSYYERTNQAPSFARRKTSWGDGSTKGHLLNGPFADNSNKWAGGGLLTTPADLVRFGLAHLRPGYLKAETLRLLFTSQRTSSGEETGYGMNWQIRTSPSGRRTYSHGGLSIGGTSTLVLYPDQSLVVAMQANLTGASYGDLADRIADLFLSEAALQRNRTPSSR